VHRTLTKEELDTLESNEDWLEEFEWFLMNVNHGRNDKVISQANCKTVMRQTRVLVSGAGIEYKHWPAGTVFKKGEPVTLKTDMVAVWYEAW
jgi:hypothetical protein